MVKGEETLLQVLPVRKADACILQTSSVNLELREPSRCERPRPSGGCHGVVGLVSKTGECVVTGVRAGPDRMMGSPPSLSGDVGDKGMPVPP